MTIAASWTLNIVAAGGKPAGPVAAPAPKPDPTRSSKPGAPSEVPLASAVPAARPGPPDQRQLDQLQLFDQFAILGTAGGYLDTQEFLKFISDAERGVTSKGLFEGRGPLAILALVFLGGLALNLTPCVLPMIPINLAIIGAGAQRSKRGRGFLLGAAYGAAMALVYGVLGLDRHPDRRHVRLDQRVALVQPRDRRAVCRPRPRDVRRRHGRFLAVLAAACSLGTPGRGTVWLAFAHGRRRRAPRRCVRRAGRHPGRGVRERPVCRGNVDRAGAAIRPRTRHGAAVADRGRRARCATEARRLDGSRQAGDGRLDSGDGRVLRLCRLRYPREPLGRSGERDGERAGEARGGVARVAGRRAPRRASIEHARASSTSGRRGARTAS